MSHLDLSAPVRHDAERMTYRQWWDMEMRRRAKRLKRLYSLPDQDRREATAADFWLCKENPNYWIEQYGWMVAPKARDEEEKVVPFVMWDQQVDLADLLMTSLSDDPPLGISDSFPVIVNKGRENGVSWLCLHLIYHVWRFQRLSSAKLLSRKESLVDDKTLDSLFGKLRYIHDRQPHHLKEREVTDVMLRISNGRNGAEIIGEATNEGAGRGGRKTIVLFDEFAHVPPRVAQQAYVSCESVAKAIWMPSTPKGKGNKFYQLYESLPEQCVFDMDWRASPYRDEEWRAMKLLTMTEDEFDQEYEASFSAISSLRIFSFNRSAMEYDESDSEWARKARTARRAWWHVGGWDFGSGPSSTVCLFSVLEERPEGLPVIWVDNELVWYRADTHQMGLDVHQKLQWYSPSFRQHWGDPAGKAKDAEQMSWEMRLQVEGIPLQVLPDSFNTREGIKWCLDQVQYLMDSGLLRVHSRCRKLWESLESWQWDVPGDIPIHMLSREWIGPKKDDPSHACNALMYLVAAVAAYFATPFKSAMTADAIRHALGSGSSKVFRTLRAARHS